MYNIATKFPTESILYGVDRLSNRIGFINGAINLLVDRIAPVKFAVACHLNCGQYCEWTDTCCQCGLNQRRQLMADVPLPGHTCNEPEYIVTCEGACSSTCSFCGGC
jgi:hypothetical protein